MTSLKDVVQGPQAYRLIPCETLSKKIQNSFRMQRNLTKYYFYAYRKIKFLT